MKLDNFQNLLFDFDEIKPPKKEPKIEPFFLITHGLPIEQIKYGVKCSTMPLTIRLDTINEVRNFLEKSLTQEETEEILQKTKENFDQWQMYKDNSMYFF